MSETRGDRVQIFAEGMYALGTLRWGWQCFRCREEETGLGSATAATEGRDNHEALGCAPNSRPDVESPSVGRGES